MTRNDFHALHQAASIWHGFPFRAERLFDGPNDTMDDDVETLTLSTHAVDFVIAEVKSN